MDPFTSSTHTVIIDADTSLLRKQLADTTRLGSQFASSLTNAFVGLTLEGRAFGDVLRSLALSLSELTLRAAFKPLESALGSIFNQVFAGGFGFSQGGTLARGTPVPFAAGGIVSSPVGFPLSGGRIGVAGERGAEAILPLARGPDGRLGVRTQGARSLAVTVNIQTADVESFRRSETQVAAMLSRAIGSGQRNL